MLLIACTPKLHVFSANDPIAPAEGARLEVALRVLQFNDSRRSGPGHEVLFLDTNEPKVDGKRRCVNGEKWYEPNAVAREVSEGIAHHIQRRGLIEVVGANARERPRFSLHGNIRALYGIQDYHWGSAIGAGFGLIGAAATAKNKSLGRVYIELNDLKLLDARGRQVASLPPVVVNFEGAMPIDAYCVATYTNVKEHFRRAAEQLAVKVERELARLTSPSPPLAEAVPAASAPTSGGEALPRQLSEQAPPQTQTEQTPPRTQTELEAAAQPPEAPSTTSAPVEPQSTSATP